jgi:hypothetical protein
MRNNFSFVNWLLKRLVVISDHNEAINRAYNYYNNNWFNDHFGDFQSAVLVVTKLTRV